MVVVALLGAAAIVTRGNAGPPPGWMVWKNLPKNLSEGHSSRGQIVIEVMPDTPNSLPGMKLLIPVKDQKQNGE